MITPATVNLRAYRWAPYIEPLVFEGVDFTGATMSMQIRLYRDAPTSLVSLVPAADGQQGLFLSVGSETGALASTIKVRVNKETLNALLLNAGRPGEDVVLFWDIVISGGGFIESRWLQGTFTIEPGVTQA